jgi:D-alanyl-D-alanine carboxypeptidase
MRTQVSIIIAAIFLASCSKTEILPPDYYNLNYTYNDSSEMHPNGIAYQSIIENGQKLGVVGVSVMIKDQYGIWTGAAGKADIANNVDLHPHQPMFIASITKVFTASLVYKLVEEGKLTLDDYVSDWIHGDILKGLANANHAQIRHLLSHTSGIPDYYTMAYDMARMNAYHNGYTHEETLEFAKSQDAYNKVGAAYRYCNTNYLLLGMIIEEASGQKLTDVFSGRLFEPLRFQSACYGGEHPIPKGVSKGYVDIYGDGKYVESKFLYIDELNTADGGIAINALETGLFFEKLMKSEVISHASLEQMTDCFALPDGWWDPKYHTMESGYGIEKFLTPHGIAYGHTGSIMGFSSVVQYFPDSDKTFVMIVNSSSYEDATQENIYNSCMEIMFDE